MDIDKSKIIAFSVFLIGTLIIIVIFYFLSEQLRNVVNFFTLYGTFASLFGICIAYLQIQSIKVTNKLTNIAVENSLNRINQVLSVSDLSKATKIIQEIQAFNLTLKQEPALLRMKDLKSILIQVKYNVELTEYTSTDLYNQHITDLGSDINNLNDLILGNKKGVNFSKVNKNLESLSTILIEFENKLKYQ